MTENVPMDSKDFTDWAYTLADHIKHHLAQMSELLVVSGCGFNHNDSMPMQCTAIFHDCKNGTLHTCYFQMKKCNSVVVFLLNTYIVSTR